ASFLYLLLMVSPLKVDTSLELSVAEAQDLPVPWARNVELRAASSFDHRGAWPYSVFRTFLVVSVAFADSPALAVPGSLLSIAFPFVRRLTIQRSAAFRFSGSFSSAAPEISWTALDHGLGSNKSCSDRTSPSTRTRCGASDRMWTLCFERTPFAGFLTPRENGVRVPQQQLVVSKSAARAAAV